MNFHEANPVPTISFNKILKIWFQDDIISSKRTFTPEASIPVHPFLKTKTVAFIEIDNPTPAELVETEE